MAAFITLGSWTAEGVHNVKGAMDRAKAAKELAQSLGGRVIGIWWTIGQCDFVSITEFPDDATFSRFALASESAGHFRTTSMRAFGEEEMQQIVQMLP